MAVAERAKLYRLHEVASLVASSVFPIRVWYKRQGDTTLQFVFERTPEFDTVLRQHADKTLHVHQAKYEAAKNVCIDMVNGLRPTDPAEFYKALDALPVGVR